MQRLETSPQRQGESQIGSTVLYFPQGKEQEVRQAHLQKRTPINQPIITLPLVPELQEVPTKKNLPQEIFTTKTVITVAALTGIALAGLGLRADRKERKKLQSQYQSAKEPVVA